MVAMAACGIAFGCLMGCGLAIIQAAHWLESCSQIAVTGSDQALSEARSVLQAMQSTSHGFCSDTDIANFRNQVFRSEYIKDAGRMQGSMIECSAALGRPARAMGPFKAQFKQQDGTLAYRSLALLENASANREALRLGSAYVVFGIELPLGPQPIPMQMALAMKGGDQASTDPAATPSADGDVPPGTSEGMGRMGDSLYVTRCSQDGFNCLTASASIPQTLYSESGMIVSVSVAGGLFGILIAMGFSVSFSRSREFSRQLRRAVQKDELKVLYQPIVNIETRRIVGAEALARWTDKGGNEVDPEVFVKTAEDLGFVGSITKKVLHQVLRDFGPTLRNRPGFRVSVNLSAADLVDPQFLPMLADSLRQAYVQPSSLVLEITERSAANSDQAMETIRNLRRMGHSIHIDDFGSGYSNLDKLLYLFADTIKIDKAFTKVIGTESVAVAILPQIINMAKSLNLEVVVEGVESTMQADYFSPGKQKIYAQGWLYGRPMAAQMLITELAGHPLLEPEDYAEFAAKPGALSVVSSAA